MPVAACHVVAAVTGLFYLALHNHNRQLLSGLHMVGKPQKMELALACYIEMPQEMDSSVDVGKEGILVVFGI